ncbi:MAG: hypothetical protein F6K36_04465 [Symploca sp. SIO3C6]|nr:hypothetical protein [Symploca sp. SIO3C6]
MANIYSNFLSILSIEFLSFEAYADNRTLITEGAIDIEITSSKSDRYNLNL